MRGQGDITPDDSAQNQTCCGNDDKGVVFEPVKEHRGDYFVEYTPARAGNYSASLATIFLKDKKPPEIRDIMEQECQKWIHRYPVPLMVTAWNDTDSVIHFEEGQESDHLFGIPESGSVNLQWKLLKNEEFPRGRLRECDLLKIYDDLPYTTATERRAEAVSDNKEFRRGAFIIAFWIVLVPVTVALLGAANPILAYLIIAYSVGKAVVCALKILGYIKRSEREKQRDAEKLRMHHHHYHCERNPEAFMRLRAENLEGDAKGDTHREAAQM